ncbi:hypothetical protein DFH07DRAFT_780751 [Mycena maculata]|uniref:Uncharacterized protein n=1 Tax=Mycena maculata TaxID=230809 RepID=A0AAD7I1J4_9AGAR|nr:hypothetical protein DFH07DRAFT_780751 [Mycena maculata]
MAPRTFLCRDCPIHGGNHYVRVVEKVAHAAEIQLHRRPAPNSGSSETTPDLPRLLSSLSLSPVPVAPSITQPTLSSDNDANLADWMTALVLTDDGPDPYHQPSKLFSERSEVQEMHAPQIPDEFHPISVPEATRSITSLVANQKPVPHRNTKGQTILLKIREDVRVALQRLEFTFDHSISREVDEMRSILDAASETVTAAGASLQALAANYHLKELRNEVVSEIQVLDRHIDVVSARLPRVPAQPDTGPVRYSAVHIFSNPIADLDLIAQMTLLLVVICNVIIGLGNNLCNFILDTVKAIIGLVMSMNVAPDATNDAEQLFVLEQLPSNLHTALKALKIDSKTTIYAVCPSCCFTHAPTEDKVTGALTTPSSGKMARSTVTKPCWNFTTKRCGP